MLAHGRTVAHLLIKFKFLLCSIQGMQCIICGGKVVYEGLLTQECNNPSCENYSMELKSREASPPPPDDDIDWTHFHLGGGIIWP